MKKALILFLGIAAALAALPLMAQPVLQPEELHVHGEPISQPELWVLNLKWNRIIDALLYTGHDAVYQPESDQGSSLPRTQIRTLFIQIPMNADVTLAEIANLESYIAQVVKPGTYTPPTGGGPGPTPIVLKEHVNDQGSTIVFDPGWQKIPPDPAAQWLEKFFQKDVTITSSTGVWASYPFRGKRIELIGEKCDNHGKAKVEVLKGTTVVKSQVIDMYQATTDAAGNPATATNWCPAGVVTAIFSSGDLPLDDYVIRWKFDSNDLTKVPRRDSMVIDGVKVYE